MIKKLHQSGGNSSTASKAWVPLVLTLIVEAMFAAVFARILITYLRCRDPLQRDVALMFSAVSVLFVLAVVREVLGEPSWLWQAVASALLLGQPFLTLRLVRRLAPVPIAVYAFALIGWVASAALLIAGRGAPNRPSALIVVAISS